MAGVKGRSGGVRDYASGAEWRALNVRRPASAVDYGEWLAAEWPWQLFATLTTRDPSEVLSNHSHYGVGAVESAFETWWSESVRTRSHEAFGVFAMESHQYRSTPHLHGLIGGVPKYVVDDVLIGRKLAEAHDGRAFEHDYLWREWFRERRGGRARIEPVTDVAAVALYVSKYVLKGMGKLYAVGSIDEGRVRSWLPG